MKNLLLFSALLVAMVILSTQTSLAQNTTFKLSDYKNPNYRYRSLDLNFGFNSYLNLNKVSNSSDIIQNDHRLNSNAGATYSSYSNSPGAQSQSRVSLGANIGTVGSLNRQDINSSNEDIIRNSFSQSENLFVSGLKRFYNEKQNYFEINGSLNTNYNGYTIKNKFYNSDTLTDFIRTKNNLMNNSVSGSFLIGKGRIEQVQDARLALYLLDDLSRLNRDNRLVTDADVLALATRITALKYQRFFDNRLRKIAEITAIDSFMQNHHLAGTPDAAYFTSLNDNWDYAYNPTRYSGRRIFSGIEAGFNYNYSKNNIENKRINESIGVTTNKQQGGNIFLVAGINYEKPISIKWQKSANIKAAIGSNYQLESLNQITPGVEIDTNNFTGTYPSLKLSADYGYGYYPNSRTWLNVNWHLSALYDQQMTGTSGNDKAAYQNQFDSYTGPRVDAYYYLSEKLRFSLTYDGELRLTKNKLTFDGGELSPEYKSTSRRWNQIVYATLTYSLF